MAAAADASTVMRYLVEGREFSLCGEDVRRFPNFALSVQEGHTQERRQEASRSSSNDVVTGVLSLPGHSAAFFELLKGFLETPLASGNLYSNFRCVLLEPPEATDIFDRIEVAFQPLQCGASATSSQYSLASSEGHNMPVFQTDFPDGPVACSEVSLALRISASMPSLPRFRVDVCDGNGSWVGLEHKSLPERLDTSGKYSVMRSFLSKAVPVSSGTVPEYWHDDGEREALFWSEARFYGIFELETMMASLLLEKLLKVYLSSCLPRVFKQWPSRDRHQFWAALWLALRFLPDHYYSQAEIDWVIVHHLSDPEPALIVAVRAELDRRGFLQQERDGSRFCVSPDRIRWVLEGDKLFRVRTFAASAGVERPWWSMPLKTQHLMLAAGPLGGQHGPAVIDWSTFANESDSELPGSSCTYLIDGNHLVLERADVSQFPESVLAHQLQSTNEVLELSGRSIGFFQILSIFLPARRADEKATARSALGFLRYRCVLLEPVDSQSENFCHSDTMVRCVLADQVDDGDDTRGDNARLMAQRVVHKEGENYFVAFECHFPRRLACTELMVTRVADQLSSSDQLRLPPFRIDVYDDVLAWRTVLCQAMPPLGESSGSGSGRGSARCFLPYAVPMQTFAVSDEWVDHQALFVTEARFYGLLELEMALGRAVLVRKLKAFMAGSPPSLSQWPTKDKPQYCAALWLALRFVPDRLYREAEVDWIITRSHTGVRVPDCPVIRKELERRGLTQRQPGGGGFRVPQENLSRALQSVLDAR